MIKLPHRKSENEIDVTAPGGIAGTPGKDVRTSG
jgi:hypothetical protein